MVLLQYELAFLMLAVMYFDLTRYKIPNWIVGLVLLPYPAAVWFNPTAVDWMMSLALAGGALLFGMLIFILRWMGGGDIKLLVACILWVGMEGLADFLTLVAILGGVVSLALIIIRWAIPRLEVIMKVETQWNLPKVLLKDSPIPYGLAIAGAFLTMLAQNQIAVL